MAGVMLPNTTNAWLLHNEKKKALGTIGEGGQAMVSSQSPPPGFKYCSDMLLCGLLGNKRKSVGVSWGGGGVIGQHNGLITLPVLFFLFFLHSD